MKMLHKSVKQLVKSVSLFSLVAISVWQLGLFLVESPEENTKSYIVSAKDYQKLKQAVGKLGVTPTHELKIIQSLTLDLNSQQLNELKQMLPVKVSLNHKVEMSARGSWGLRKWQPIATVPSYIGANYAHANYNFGDDVTIGFLDTGLDQLEGISNGLGLSNDLYGQDKFWGTYNAVNDTISNYSDEENGHGTHVASIAGNSDYDMWGRVYGVAPNAALLGIKAFDQEGKATYADVIRGIGWALEVKDLINLRVLNMSFSGPVRSFYWDDPLNIAVMKAWEAGVVVVASAGNNGSAPMTIGVPGNIPYIITVGAITDNYTETNFYDDKLASFSAAGPTVEGFVKPDLLAPGGHMTGLMAFDTQIATEHPEFHDGGRYFQMSGTSQAAAVVSGVVALMLSREPSLTPDDVKCRLMDTARAALNQDGSLAYSVFQQGAGVVDAAGALRSYALGCANQELDIAQDLNGDHHYFGPANVDEEGNFYIEGASDEYVWNYNAEDLDGTAFIWKNQFWADAFIWKNTVNMDAFIWKNAFETDAFIWKNNFQADAFIWKNSLETDAFIWKNNKEGIATTTIGINTWVEQE